MASKRQSSRIEDLAQVRNLAVRLQEAGTGSPAVFLFCAMGAGQGTSTLAAATAGILATGDRRVVLAEVRGDAPGRTAGGVPLAQAIADPTMLVTGKSGPARLRVPASLIDLAPEHRDPRRWASCDCLLIDAPPIHVFLTRNLVPLVDGVVLILQGEKTSVRAVARARRDIEARQGRLIGAIMTRHRSYIPRFVERSLGNA
jgi:hypothetical protein